MLKIDYKDRRPIYEQIVSGVAEWIRRGVFEQGEQLPSVRSLAMELSLNPNTVQRAFNELEQKGIIYCVKGKGNFVADGKEAQAQEKSEIEQGIRELARRAGLLGMTAQEWQELAGQAWRNNGECRGESGGKKDSGECRGESAGEEAAQND